MNTHKRLSQRANWHHCSKEKIIGLLVFKVVRGQSHCRGSWKGRDLNCAEGELVKGFSEIKTPYFQSHSQFISLVILSKKEMRPSG